MVLWFYVVPKQHVCQRVFYRNALANTIRNGIKSYCEAIQIKKQTRKLREPSGSSSIEEFLPPGNYLARVLNDQKAPLLPLA
jgi:hypothetical protein